MAPLPLAASCQSQPLILGRILKGFWVSKDVHLTVALLRTSGGLKICSFFLNNIYGPVDFKLYH